jgi:hypothetical protein
MEIVAGEPGCYRLLAFISLKMELQMVSPIGQIRLNLPFFKKFTQENGPYRTKLPFQGIFDMMMPKGRLGFAKMNNLGIFLKQSAPKTIFGPRQAQAAP